jgi:hypothetical protein
MKLLEYIMHSLLFLCVGATLFVNNDKVEIIAIDEGERAQEDVEQLEDDCDEVNECR